VSANITISTASGQLLFVLQGQSVLLWWQSADVFQVYVPPLGYVPCLIAELDAFNHQYVMATRDGNGVVATIAVPGYYPGVTWLKAPS